MDMARDRSEEMRGRFCEHFALSEKVRPFFDLLVSGVIRRLALIDGLIERFSKNWKLDRMACVDRNILRMAVYEILYCADIPPKVSINEAVDIGKKYGTEDSGAFINGILDSIRIAYESDQIRSDAAGDECPVSSVPVNTD